MKQLFAICMILGCSYFGLAQGLQGKAQVSGSATVAVTGHSVTLTWSASQNTTSYNIYRGTTHGGPYLKVASGIVSPTYTDAQVASSQTLYYVTTSVNGNNESSLATKQSHSYLRFSEKK
jgi:fibronectin type 3 domain-containing protein